jgi:transposase
LQSDKTSTLTIKRGKLAPFTEQQRVFTVREWYITGHLYNDVATRFETKFNRDAPDLATVYRWVHKLENTATLRDKPYSRRPSVITEKKIDTIKKIVTAHPDYSVRRIAELAGETYSTTYNILRRELKLRPYKVQLGQLLKPTDCELRIQYCRRMLDRVQNEGIQLFDKYYYTDEAWFTLTGYVNKQNTRKWLNSRPVQIETTTLHPLKLGVWAAISRTRLIYIFFYSTVDSEVYRGFIDDFVSHFDTYELDSLEFQQDGARVHTCNASMDYLYLLFPPDRITSNPLWPPRSPDLSPPDNFLWSYTKNGIYRNNPQTLDNLRTEIINRFATIDRRMLENVFENQVRRMQLCLDMNGGHFEHLL